MESETYTFDRWLESISEQVASLNLQPALEFISSQILQRFATRCWFAHILGRRWSYWVGLKSYHPAWSGTTKIPLENNIGLVVEAWGVVMPNEQDRFRAFLAQLLISK